MRRGLAVAALGAALAAVAPPADAGDGLPPCRTAPCASDRAPVVVLSYYQSRHYARLVRAVSDSGLPDRTPVYYGNYWGSGKPSEPKPPQPRPRPPMPNGRLAPIFPIARSVFWHKRAVPRADGRILRAKGQRRWAGRMPTLDRILRRSGRYRYAWGLELGRRFRDRIRNKRRHGTKVVTWQLDEIVSEVAGPGGARMRGFLRGVMQGLAYGRRPLGDEKLPGFVFVTQKALRLAGRPARGDLKLFWRTLDRATLYLIGEEYPDFAGPPKRAARRMSSGQRNLRRFRGPRRSLSRKYVVGMTPGYRMGEGLGGNVNRRPRKTVNSWRRAFIRSRSRSRPAGLGVFGFRHANSSRTVMNDVLRALAAGVRTGRR